MMVNKKEIKEKVINIINENFDMKLLYTQNEEVTLKDLGIDSLAVVTLIIEIEEQFELDIYSMDIDLAKLNTIKALVDIISKLVNDI